MPPDDRRIDAIGSTTIPTCAASARDERRQAVALLWRAARPDRRQLGWATRRGC